MASKSFLSRISVTYVPSYPWQRPPIRPAGKVLDVEPRADAYDGGGPWLFEIIHQLRGTQTELEQCIQASPSK
jgi:hypothetical protein